MKTSSIQWICAQLGAREHYSIPRALHQHGLLKHLITEFWVPPGDFPLAKTGLGERFHKDVPSCQVLSWNSSAITFEIASKIRRLSGWEQIMKRNAWFQRQAIRRLEGVAAATPGKNFCLFSYSYTALELFRFARKQGWKTVLGQIDPAEREEQIVSKLEQSNPTISTSWKPAPRDYWKLWRQECEIADHIVVNSEWSKTALTEVGMPAERLHVIPLSYEEERQTFDRVYPGSFSKDRPLKVLFLGQIILRKGMAEVLAAIGDDDDSPVEFWFVGNPGFDVPREFLNRAHIRWMGGVPRSRTSQYYRDADVFLFPTHSDGFGLTQLEAQNWKLPIIASKFCGEVVQHDYNGWLLNDVSKNSIREALAHCIKFPENLKRWSDNTKVTERFTLQALGSGLNAIIENKARFLKVP